MNNDSNRHIFEETIKLNDAKFRRDRLDELYESSPTNSILIEINKYNKIILEIRKYLCHISSNYRRTYIDFEPDSVYMIF
jgi:hypothetical protein